MNLERLLDRLLRLLTVASGVALITVVVVTGGHYPEPHHRVTGDELERIETCLAGSGGAQAAAFRATLRESGGDIGAALKRVQDGRVRFYGGDEASLDEYRAFLVCAARR